MFCKFTFLRIPRIESQTCCKFAYRQFGLCHLMLRTFASAAWGWLFFHSKNASISTIYEKTLHGNLSKGESSRLFPDAHTPSGVWIIQHGTPSHPPLPETLQQPTAAYPT